MRRLLFPVRQSRASWAWARMTYREIASALETSEEVVRVTVSRARKRLREPLATNPGR